MKINRTIKDASDIKNILTALITNTEFLKRIHAKEESFGIFREGFASIIAEWCFLYFEEYGEAPGIHIEDIYNDALRAKEIEEDYLELVEDILGCLNKEHMERATELNINYLVDKAVQLGTIKDLESFKKELSEAIQQEDIEYAEKLIKEQKESNKKLKEVPLTRPLLDPDVASKIMKAKQSGFIHMKGALGELISPLFRPKTFVAVMGKAKIGKTFLLDEIAMRGVMARLNVLLVQSGDLSEEQQLERLFSWMGRKPLKSFQCGKFMVPVLDCLHNQRNECTRSKRKSIGRPIVNLATNEIIEKDLSEYEVCTRCQKINSEFHGAPFYVKETYDKPLQVDEILQCQKIFQYRTKGKDFRLLSYSTKTFSMDDLRDVLVTWEREDNYKPDLIVFDYLDIAKACDERKAIREAEAEKWAGARRISLEHKCCFVAGTQADSNAMKTDTITVENFSETRMKWDHPTSAIGINQTEEEKRKKLIRVNVFLDRDNVFDVYKQAVCLQNLNVGNFHVDSYWRKKKETNKEEE